MVTQTAPAVFQGLREASLDATQSIYRLSQLGSPNEKFDGHEFNEETLTDLLIAYLTGAKYRVDGDCPKCASAKCLNWSGKTSTHRPRRFLVQPTTKAHEGRTTKAGPPAGADYALAIKGHNESELRLLIQAKKIGFGHTYTLSAMKDAFPEKQLKVLNAAMVTYDAVPIYALYVMGAGPHDVPRTACRFTTRAADASMLLVPAVNVERWIAQLPLESDTLIAESRPFSCLFGCPCLKTSAAKSNPFTTAEAFLNGYGVNYTTMPKTPSQMRGAIQIVANTEKRSRSARASRTASRAKDGSKTRFGKDAVLVVRLTGWRRDEHSLREGLGWRPNLTIDDERDATRMYWKVDPSRAESVRYIVGYSAGRARTAYKVRSDGVVIHNYGDGSRKVEFEVDELDDQQLRDRLFRKANNSMDPKGRYSVRYL